MPDLRPSPVQACRLEDVSEHGRSGDGSTWMEESVDEADDVVLAPNAEEETSEVTARQKEVIQRCLDTRRRRIGAGSRDGHEHRRRERSQDDAFSHQRNLLPNRSLQPSIERLESRMESHEPV